MLPDNINSELSADKKTLIINIGDYSFDAVSEPLLGEGIIRSIKFFSESNVTSLHISLSENRGYTISSLPYQQAIMVDFFD